METGQNLLRNQYDILTCTRDARSKEERKKLFELVNELQIINTGIALVPLRSGPKLKTENDVSDLLRNMFTSYFKADTTKSTCALAY